MGNTTQKYRIYHYDNRNGYELVEELNVRNSYDSKFWHRPMPTIGERKCKQILKNLYPWMQADNIPVLIENVETGFKHEQRLYRNGTIIVT